MISGKDHPPILVPYDYQPEFFMLTKSELMDILWDYAMQIARVEDKYGRMLRENIEPIAFNEFRQRRDNVLQRRRKAQQGSK